MEILKCCIITKRITKCSRYTSDVSRFGISVYKAETVLIQAVGADRVLSQKTNKGRISFSFGSDAKMPMHDENFWKVTFVVDYFWSLLYQAFMQTIKGYTTRLFPISALLGIAGMIYF